MRLSTTLLCLIIPLFLFCQTEPDKDNGSASNIQVCLILDISGSMSGLLSQAQGEIWKMMSFLKQFKKEEDTAVELALITYGNFDGHESGYIKIHADFSSDLETIVLELTRPIANGGEEYCGQAIAIAADSLSWRNTNNYKTIIIAGNESFAQGPINYAESIQNAIDSSVIVNTIYCGSKEEGILEEWQTAAELGTGNYLTIDQSIEVDSFRTPYDQKLVNFYYNYRATYMGRPLDLIEDEYQQFIGAQEISPTVRDYLIYRFLESDDHPDIIDDFSNNNWELDD